MKLKRIILFIVIIATLQACKEEKTMDKNYNADILIKNGLVVTVDKAGTIYQKGNVVVKDGYIIEISENDLSEKYTAKETIDANGKIVMPGLVNTHTHMAMTLFRGLADDIALQSWLHDYMFPAEAEFINKETVKAGVELAMVEMIHSGTTTFNDMYFFEDELAKSAKKIGMRGIINESLIDYPTPSFKNPEGGFAIIKKLIEKYKNDSLITVGVAVHSPYTCSPKLLQDAKKLANENSMPYHIHVAETKWEFDSIQTTYKKTPVKYLFDLGVMDDKTIAAHCVWLTPDDIKIMAENGVGVAHNPECNMKISSGVAPIPELLAAGVEVGLGTDGVASNNNLNMIEEMHTMALLHKLNKMKPTVIPAETVVRTATIGSAKVLGMEKEIGSLEKGKKADIILIDINKPNTTPIYNVYSAIVYSVSGTDVCDVVIDGKLIMKDKKILTANEQEIMQTVSKIAVKIRAKLVK